MATVKIRPAERDDAGAIRVIWNHYIRETTVTFTSDEKRDAEVADLIALRAEAFLVVENGSGLAGFASFGQFRAGPGYRGTAEHTVLLAPDARGQGLGRSLMQALETQARATGYRTLIGGLSAENDAALVFHRAIGFEEAGRIRHAGLKFGRRIDLIFMQKMLDTPPDSGSPLL
ncbi:phosphinothricin acetyltransferase [Roseivivax halotolerans]|uniref:Phosphinothricin acetyltransferase n=1 Tax=Roseivivax halotolerans TaxID=93684 RepID=A0A1I5Z8U8_9RHOB|nr:phosphinothricin acetyltransferase [Roseivivax halotolerans]